MTGQELYAHYWDATYCESGAGEVGFKLPAWGELEKEEQAGWNRLAQCFKEGQGVTIGWLYEPVKEYEPELDSRNPSATL